jgi:2-keto-4-pentenoate hydratase/2-oxohepta-3-ene-1,7-dioic acid hydratase in catechol pathway
VNQTKIARFLYDSKESYGAIDQENNLVCLPSLGQQLNRVLPSTIDVFIANEEAQRSAFLMLKESENSAIKASSIPISKVSLLPPIPFPPKIVCLGWNYIDHTEERKVTPPEEPVFFMKPHTAIIGPKQEILKRLFVKELDYEGELAVVIGRKTKDLPEDQALDCVFGYTILNDVSARDYQFKDKQWTRGKGFDTFAPTGPWITTKDELPNTSHLKIQTSVNGELRQNGSTSDMIFNINKIIYHLSRVMTLEPCDIISTGTPSGVAMAMNPPKWLVDGDIVRIEIEGIGILENQVKEK